MIQISRPSKLERNKIDLSDSAPAHHWAKKVGKSKEEIAAAVENGGRQLRYGEERAGMPRRILG